MNKEQIKELGQTRHNGNISDFNEKIQKMTKPEMLQAIDVWERWGIHHPNASRIILKKALNA